MLFPPAVQPSTISLFSSTSSNPLDLFSSSTDSALLSDSFVHLLHDRISRPLPDHPRTLLHLPTLTDRREEQDSPHYGVELEQTVLHMQSPTLRTTYIHCPPGPHLDTTHDRPVGLGLGIKHPWMHIQVRNLGREWAFEVGVADHVGRTGIIRFSTFQKKPRLKMNHKKLGSPPLLLLPLSFPLRTSRPLTPWSTIKIHFPSLLPFFSSLALRSASEDNQEVGPQEDPESRRWTASAHPTTSNPVSIPSGTYSSVSYVRVYANCRLRRIWFGESGPSQNVPWEFELYSADLPA